MSQSGEHSVRIHHGSIRTSAGSLRVARRAVPWDGARAFADAILKRAIPQRHSGGWRGWAGIGLVFWQSWPGVVVQPQHYHSRLHLTPRLNLTVLIQRWTGDECASPDTAAPGRPTQPAGRQQPAGPSPVWQTPAPARRWADVPAQQPRRRIETTAVERVVRRLLMRSERVESVAGPSSYLTQPASPEGGQQEASRRMRVSPAQPVFHVVRRSAAGVAVEGQLPVPATAQVPGGEHTARALATRGARQEGAALPDLNRLADQVIQTIDRRITAQREWMGRA